MNKMRRERCVSCFSSHTYGVSFHFANNLASDLLLIYYYIKMLQCSRWNGV